MRNFPSKTKACIMNICPHFVVLTMLGGEIYSIVWRKKNQACMYFPVAQKQQFFPQFIHIILFAIRLFNPTNTMDHEYFYNPCFINLNQSFYPFLSNFKNKKSLQRLGCTAVYQLVALKSLGLNRVGAADLHLTQTRPSLETGHMQLRTEHCIA